MFDALFTDPEVDQLFTDEAIIQAMLRFEGALALAQADIELVPLEHAHSIEVVCQRAKIDAAKLSVSARQAGNPAIPLVKELSDLVCTSNPEAARFVHAGATSQDVIDSATMIQLKSALWKITSGLQRLQPRLVQLINEHRGTMMIGRTLLQQARPISFAFKAANWFDQLARCASQVRRVSTQALVLQFGGAVGTLAGTGPDALAIRSRLAERLELAEPAMPWHTARDRFFEIGSACAMLSGCLGKIATDVSLLMQTEIGELAEAGDEGRGGSSAMPHKRNPIAPTMIIAGYSRIPGLLATMAASMIQEHERGVGRWHAEWGTLADIVPLTAGAVKHANDLFSHLEVNSAQMRENIDSTQGLVYAEDVSIALAKRIGKPEADQLVKRACQRAREKGRHLRHVLGSDPSITNILDQAALDEIFQPENALGVANQLIDRALKENRHISGDKE